MLSFYFYKQEVALRLLSWRGLPQLSVLNVAFMDDLDKRGSPLWSICLLTDAHGDLLAAKHLSISGIISVSMELFFQY